MKNNIMKGRSGILVILILVILLICVNNFFIRENFKDALDNVDAMNKKMDNMTDMEKETRMFCKLLRHDEDREQLQDLLESRNQEFQDNWQKQNKIVSDIKKKFIKLRLEKDGRNFKDFNDKRNKRLDENIKRNKVVKQAKKIAQSPYNLDVNINNNS